ncbi:MAG: hypothetical protein HY094_02145 [Candidatus Melainabacteria bacterium]|nr:hypothetical protein [Candidatus Melainabacteria bacterium]
MKKLSTKKLFSKVFLCLLLALIFVFNISLPIFSADSADITASPNVTQNTVTLQANSPMNNNPVCLLVGLSNNELSYRELSSLSGFELFSVPYRADIKTLIEQIKPSQIIIKHPSGFVGLYSVDGQLIRGVQTTTSSEFAANPGAIPPSIIQPTEANPIYENVYYPGSQTGAVPHGGVGYTPSPKGKGFARHLLKIASFGLLVPFQYPNYFRNNTLSGVSILHNKNSLFTSLLVPAIPSSVSAAASYADSRFDASEYEQGRTQPRDYMFQPVIEGY